MQTTTNTITTTDYSRYEPETEAKVTIDSWGGITVPCDIIDVFDQTGDSIKTNTDINEKCTALVQVYVGTAEDLNYRPEKFYFTVSIQKLTH